MLLIFVAIIFLASGVHVSLQSGVEAWGYWGDHGPPNWGGLCKTGKHQSPIDIVSDDTIMDDLGSLKFTRYDFAYTGTLTNNGHTVQITLSGVPMFLNGGGLTTTYVLEQMHFHWASEHTIDGQRDPLELHLVHYDKRYGNVSSAAQHSNGISVVAVLFELSNDDNEDLYPILKAAEMVSQWVGKSSIEIQRKLIPQLLLPKDRTSFYRYEGSLTTPGCQEAVTWFVLTEKLTVSAAQLNIFHNVQTEGGPLKFNYRPTQEINDRKIYHHLLGYTSKSNRIVYNFNITLLLLISLFSYSSSDF